jgi:carbon-monoxide dehydrogenase medium subunit
MNLWQQYLRPRSILEALQALTSAPSPVCVIAGGTDLMLDLQQGRHSPVHTLVDLNAIPEMTALEIRERELFVGAAVPLSRIAFSNLTQEHAQALVEACHLIGGSQVRNMATLGGNVAHALPAADGTIALIALDTRVEVAGPEGHRHVPLSSLFLGPGHSALKVGQELIVGFNIPLCSPHQASAFQRIMCAQGIALPILNLAVWLHRRADRIIEANIAVGPSGPTPQRMNAAEEVLRGQVMNSGVCSQAIEALLRQVHFRTSLHRASAEYRQHLVASILVDTLETAWQRAK